MGTFLFNDDNGLGVFFGFVPNVPKLFERYPEESLLHQVDECCLFIRFCNDLARTWCRLVEGTGKAAAVLLGWRRLCYPFASRDGGHGLRVPPGVL